MLEPDSRCSVCGFDRLSICDHRHRYVDVLDGPLHVVSKLAHCMNPQCPTRGHTISPSAELIVAPPRLSIGWDVFAWIGQRRIARDWRVPQIREELQDSYQIDRSEDSIERHIARYQAILAAREQDPDNLALAYRGSSGIILSIDGLQPEKGHETLYVVREVTEKRVWFAIPLLSSASSEIARLFVLARDWATRLGIPVKAWISDKQQAFVTGIADLFPGVPHRYCANHFLRDAAKPVLALDSHAKVRMRTKVRGLREIERAVLQDCAEFAKGPAAVPPASTPERTAELALVPALTPAPTPALTPALTPAPTSTLAPEPMSALNPSTAGAVVLEYCAAVRGILTDDQGGPLCPTGLRMADALAQVKKSLERCTAGNIQCVEHGYFQRLAGCIDRGLAAVAVDLAIVRGHAQTLKSIWDCLDPLTGNGESRKASFDVLAASLRHDADPLRLHMGAVMTTFARGLFAAPDDAQLPIDNLDLERAFKRPKHHRRHIHGRSHAGSGLVPVGATLLPALDAHMRHRGVFSPAELAAWRNAQPPACQRDALHRRSITRKARSKKKRPLLLAELESRYLGDG